MAYDVIVVGGGAAGSVAAAVLAKEGKSVLLLERDAGLAGRARYFDVDGYRLQWGPHLLEDPGSGITAILGWLGETLEHGDENDAMAIWTDEGWKQAGEVYGGDQNRSSAASRPRSRRSTSTTSIATTRSRCASGSKSAPRARA